jgi:3'-phosphoadenosine 5'-phosphosulfate sulfotransferase (PAPS reductase)/FAD synthetase
MKKLVISFSGGRTSGYMTKKILDTKAGEYEIKVIFANTGFENEATLQFVHDCDTQFGFNTVWLEGVTNEEMGVGMSHKLVTFETASRNGEPFEEMIQKYGITNMQSPQCTRNLKRYPIESYLKSIGWGKRDYDLAIGIRTDELRRVKDDKSRSVVYPLVDWFPADKQDVLDWWEDQAFDLQLLEHQGNCKTCWKKSMSKLMRLHDEDPTQFDFFERMEEKYPRVGAEFQKYNDAPDRVFFRGRTSIKTFRLMALNHKDMMSRAPTQLDLYADGGCSESCELYETE